jgi:hypothetical protein
MAATIAKTPNKSDFIRAQPASLSVADVIAKGKAEGIKIGSSLVYMVRGRSSRRAKKGASKTAPAKPPVAPVTSAAPKSAAAKTPAKTKSKAAFVRAFPSLSPKEIIEKAKADGVKFDANYVYRVRAMVKTARKAKRAAAKTPATKPTSTNGARPLVTSPATTSSPQDLLRAVAAELGLGRAIEILQGERARVQALLRG